MKRSVQNILLQMKRLELRLDKIRERCSHKTTTKEYGANTGNYDPSADVYWTDFTCSDCGYWWRETERANK
jgi:hypothetical protein